MLACGLIGNFFGGVRMKNRTPREPNSLLDGVEFARTRLGFEPDAKQAEVLRSQAKRGILNCSRQWGKSTVAAAKAVHRVYTEPNCLVIVASPSARQSGELLRKAAEFLHALNIAPRGDGHNRMSLVLPNGSRIVGLPGRESTGRGFSKVSLVLIDEAAAMDEAMYRMLHPMVAVSNGDIWLMSTPRGKRGFFYNVWEHGGPSWMKVKGPATECPRIPKDYLEEERLEMGRRSFRQEFLCDFMDTGWSVFNSADIDAALDEYEAAFDFGSTWDDED
jgi:hypothetical protein